MAVATYAPPRPTLTLEPQLPNQDVYEVRIYDSRRHRQLIAAIKIVSPSNKDRPESRSAFIAKVATLLKNGICVSIVDVVTTVNFNLYADLLSFVKSSDPALGVCKRLAIEKAQSPLDGSVAASDAFFPFRDGVDVLVGAGIRAIVQPGGSVRDEEVVKACNECGVAMVFTGKRHFRHS